MDDSPPDEEAQQRQAAVAAMQKLDTLGLNRGSTGNLSLRQPRQGCMGMLITPTGMAAADLQPSDLVWVADDGQCQGAWQPSSEWHFHRAVYRARPDLHAVVHTHATHAMALACLRRPLPAFHYMVAVAGGSDVPLVPYHLFGTEALSQGVAAAMQQRLACLLANHGLVTAGRTLAQALKVMQEVEALCQAYLLALAVDEPVLLSQAEMAAVIQRFSTYGQAARVSNIGADTGTVLGS